MQLLFIFSIIALAYAGVPNRFQYGQQDVADFRANLEDPPKFYTTIEMIKMDGYPAENHYTTTSDGYILNLHRIPHGKSGQTNGKVVYLQHGLLTSSSDWIIMGPEKSLAYILADEGYDVWLGNARGNTYSRNHTIFNPDKDGDFWQFSWHQIGTTDLPTMIDYILEQTGADGVYYSGHSQGTTSYYVMASMRPEYNAKVKTFVHLAPIAFMNHLTSPLLRIIAMFEGPVEELIKLIGMNEFVPTDSFLGLLISDICSGGIGEELCKNSLFALCGFSPAEMNNTLLPLIMVHTPAGAATKQLLHYSQEIASGYFREYDFGKQENIKIYGQDTPPNYDLSKITSKGYLINGPNDWLAAEVDVQKLVQGLGASCIENYLVPEKDFNHLDFVYGVNSPTLINAQVVKYFAKH